MQVAVQGTPLRMVQPLRIGDQRRVRERWIAHPDPDPAMLLHDGKSPDPRVRWNPRLRRDADTLPGSIEQQAVIHAADLVASLFLASHGQLGTAVTTAIHQR